MAQTVHFAGHLKPVGIQTRSTGAGAVQRLIGIPQLQAGRDYVFVAQGVFGASFGVSGSPEESLAAAEVLFTYGTGANRLPTEKAARVRFALGTKLNNPLRGQPFQLIWRNYSYDPATPTELCARVNTMQQNPALVGGGFFVQAQLLVFDITTITGNGWTIGYSEFGDSAGTDLPRTDEAPFFVHAEFAAWNPTRPELLVFTESRVQPGSQNLPWRMDLRAGPSGGTTAIASWGSIGTHSPPAPFYQGALALDEMGSWRTWTPAAGTDELQFWGRSGWPGATYPAQSPARFHGGGIFQVPTAALDFQQHKVTAPSQTAFYADAPPALAELEINPDIGAVFDEEGEKVQASSRYVILTRSNLIGLPGATVVGAPIVTHNSDEGTRVKRQTTMGAAKFSPTDPFGVALPFTTPANLFELAYGREVNRIRMQGWHTAAEPQGQATLSIDREILGFLEVDEDPRTNTVVTAGPEVAVALERETLDLGSLAALPVVPDAAQPTQLEGVQVTEHIAERGDRRSWPLLLKTRQIVQLQWSRLSADERAALLAFLESTGQHVFKTTTAQDPTERAYTVLGGTWADDETGARGGGGRLYRASLEAVELTWLGA